MAPLPIRASLWLMRTSQRPSAGVVALVLCVAAVWLAIFETIVHTVPTPSQLAQPSPAYAVGQLAHLRGIAGIAPRLPVELDTFQDFYRALWDDNSLAINEVLSRPGWIQAVDGQAVRIIDVYEHGFQVELLDGPSAGRHAWVMVHHLSP